MRILAWPAQKFRSTNPYTYLLYRGMERLGISVEEFSTARLLAGRHDIWHIHWPEHFLNGSGKLQARAKALAIPALMDAAHALGTRIIWTTHNLYAHEHLRPEIEDRFWAHFTKRVDGFISLSHSARELATKRHLALRSVPGFVIPHGHFREEYPITYNRHEAREKLGLVSSGPVILNFGAIRPYKGIPELISAFRKVPSPSAILMIVGLCRNEILERQIRDEAGRDPRIRILLQGTPADEVQMYFAAADVVILPYKEILNSGSAMLSLSLDRPVYVPALGSMPELRDSVGDLWLRTYHGEFVTGVLEDALDWARVDRPLSTPLNNFDWDNLRTKTVEAYCEVIRTKKSCVTSVLQPNN
ncbi:MAG: glycosyltransferase [Candidatus Acidoferrum typicum]|nr:glycosyltransferase [Candidatus Acidoferrum typicum]